MARLILLGALGSVVALVAHIAVLPSRPAAGAAQPLLMQFAGHHNVLLTSAWLDGLGSALLILTAVAIAHLAGAGSTLPGRIVQVTGTVVIALSLVSDTLLIATAQAGALGDGATVRTAYSLLSAGDYVYPVANTFWLSALGLVVLRTSILPRAFGYLALALGAAELVIGLAKLYSDTVHNVINYGFMAILAWVLAASITLAIRPIASRSPSPEREPAVTAI